ncbi:hypothetical protein NPIL_429351 [Nephila pilipes]|uniref:Uncharacterized protein n=1 Tax=Nephila pilipes TaxID=299642 RepID=A0A8X6QA70_NEPPI|nr:hypothetical protein NPIL_429351 [Nephila pilipes]
MAFDPQSRCCTGRKQTCIWPVKCLRRVFKLGSSSRAIHTYKNSQDGGRLASVLFSNINKKIRDYSSTLGLEAPNFPVFLNSTHTDKNKQCVCMYCINTCSHVAWCLLERLRTVLQM